MYVPWVSQAFSLSLHQEERKRDSNLVPNTSLLAPGLGRRPMERSWERGWCDSERGWWRHFKTWGNWKRTKVCQAGRYVSVTTEIIRSERNWRWFVFYCAGKAEILNYLFTYKLSFFFQNCTSMKQNFFSCFYSSIFREYDSARGNLRHELQMLFSLLLV